MEERRGTDGRVMDEAALLDTSGPGAGHRDAAAIMARTAADETAALEARSRYRDRVMEPIEPDAPIAELLGPGEEVLAVRRSALLERRQPPPGTALWPAFAGLGGDMYVTSGRLALVGRTVVAYDLDAIREAVVSGERLLVTLRDGTGVIIQVDRPRLFRVEIGAARARLAERRRAASSTEPGPASG
jgi:hypothetical protein